MGISFSDRNKTRSRTLLVIRGACRWYNCRVPMVELDWQCMISKCCAIVTSCAICKFLRTKVQRYQNVVVGISSLQNHADGINRLTTYDFILVFYRDLRSRCNCVRVVSRQKSTDCNRFQEAEQEHQNYELSMSYELALLYKM